MNGKEESVAANNEYKSDDVKVSITNEKEDWEIQRDQFKAEADDAFRSKQYTKAVKHYTDAIGIDPENVVLFSNRSASYLARGEKSRSLHDAQACVRFDPKFVKGYTRLGAALMSLGRLSDARKIGYGKALELDPKCHAAKDGIDKVSKMERAKIESERELARAASETQRKIHSDDKAETSTSLPCVINRSEVSETTKHVGKNNGNDDLLDDFFADVESAETPKIEQNANQSDPAVEKSKTNSGSQGDASVEDENSKITAVQTASRIKLLNSDLGTSLNQIERLLPPSFEWKNLNPYNVLQIPHDVEHDTVQRRYKALSLLVHPDKCRDPRARDAFEEVRKAMKSIEDETKRKHVQSLIEAGRKQGKREWIDVKQKRKAKSIDKSSSEKAFANEDAVASAKQLSIIQEKAVMKLFAEIERSRRDVEMRKRKQEKRERQQEDEIVKKEKEGRDFDKKWREENRVGKRVGNWRDFQQDGLKKKKKH